MKTSPPADTDVDAPATLRLWPGVVLVALQWFIRFLLPLLIPATVPFAILGGLALGLAVVIWWVFFSRAPRLERWIGLGMIVASLAITPLFLHESLATGMMGLIFFIYVAPTLGLALVAWAALSRPWSTPTRLATLALALLVACGGWALVRTEGVTGGAQSQFAWRFQPTLEERTLERLAETSAVASSTAELGPPVGAAWPGFRGPNRDGIARAATLRTDWATNPPTEIWRRPIGPGWSSFALQGDRLYTQEQRGDDEVVACYRASTGEPLWQHADPARFWESNAGAGPRATPTVNGDRVYALGATGLLNALDAVTGRVLWTRDVATDTGADVPMWGFSGSPLAVGDQVFAAASGRIAAYDRATGDLQWTAGEGGDDYSSPHALTLDGVDQIVLMNTDGATGYAPSGGAQLWHRPLARSSRIVQPAQTPDGDLLVSQGSSRGLRRLGVHREADTWTLTERWETHRLKPYFSDFVVHGGHAYGFDGGILAAIDLETGERAWKGGRYGDGQLVLVPDQDLLLVLGESGELVLVAARPDGFEEIAEIQALEFKTWNHPVLAGARLWVRNGQEMVAFELGG